MVNQTSLNHNAKLVIQANDSNIEKYWNGIELKNEIRNTNKWIKFSKTVIIPEQIKQADIIKVYVYNPSQEIIYIDDFSVKFINN